VQFEHWSEPVDDNVLVKNVLVEIENRVRPGRRDLIMTIAMQPHRTRGHRPGYLPTALTDITIRIHATPSVDPEVWRALHTEIDSAIDASLQKHGLAGVREAGL
jgi:hypothetical protein